MTFGINDLITIDSDQWDDVGVVFRIDSIDYNENSFSFKALLTNTETGYQYDRTVPIMQAQKVYR